MKVIKQVVYDDKRDADILAWLSRHDNESAATRDAIREKMGVSVADVYRKLVDFELDIFREMHALKRNGLAAADPDYIMEPVPGDIDQQAAAAIDKLLGG